MQRNWGAYGKDYEWYVKHVYVYIQRLFSTKKTITRRRVLCYNVCKCYAKFCSGIVIDDDHIFCNEVSNDIKNIQFQQEIVLYCHGK